MCRACLKLPHLIAARSAAARSAAARSEHQHGQDISTVWTSARSGHQHVQDISTVRTSARSGHQHGQDISTMNGGTSSAGRDSIASTTSSALQHAGGRSKNIRPAPSEIEFKEMKFLITDRPSDSTMASYVEELCRHAVKDVVRVCEPTYQTEQLSGNGITVTDLVFDDGTAPPAEIVEEWLELLRTRHRDAPGSTIAVHCVAGLGRAPVLVAIALMELGMRYEDAVHHIRQKRRGAINAKQLSYLEKYRPKGRLRLKNGKTAPGCTVQ